MQKDKLEFYPINESRCPKGAECFWAGFAAATFNLIVDGNTEHTFSLATIDLPPELRRDTLINGIIYKLLDITPYPDLRKEHKVTDFEVRVSIEKKMRARARFDKTAANTKHKTCFHFDWSDGRFKLRHYGWNGEASI